MVGYFEAAHAAYLRAERDGAEQFTFATSGLRIAVRSPQSELLGLITRAFRHLQVANGAADLTICVWERHAPPAPFTWFPGRISDASDTDAPVEYPLPDSSRIRTSTQLTPHMLRMLDFERDLGLFWVQDAARLPYWEVKAPFRHILSWWMSARRRIYLHGGAVGAGGKGVLVAGRSGAGKSTSSLACLAGGMDYLADDYCLVNPDGQPSVSSLYNSAKLKGEADLARFPQLAADVQNSGQLEREQPFLFLYPKFARQLTGGFPIRAILFPQVTGVATPRLIPISRAAALVALAPSTMSQLPETARQSIPLMKQLVEKVPSYRLEVGPDVAEIPKAIGRFLEDS